MREETKQDWKGFYPKTNLLWLDYVTDKLTKQLKYKNKKSSRTKCASFTAFRKRILTYKSTMELIDDPFFSDLIVNESVVNPLAVSKHIM